MLRTYLHQQCMRAMYYTKDLYAPYVCTLLCRYVDTNDALSVYWLLFVELLKCL